MSPPTDQSSSSPDQNSGSQNPTDRELVEQVADLVFKMWKKELTIERERYRTKANPFNRSGGI